MNVGDLVAYVGAPVQGLTAGDLGSIKGVKNDGELFWVSFDSEKPSFEAGIDEIQLYDGPIYKPEAVDHPKHYNEHPSGVECIDVVRHMNFNLGNVIKYLWRADHKGVTIEDLEKAKWYLQDEIDRLKKQS